MTELVRQRAFPEHGYAGPILHGRYQVLGASVAARKFLIVDLFHLNDGKVLVKAEKGDGAILFDSKTEAEGYAAQLAKLKAKEKKPLERGGRDTPVTTPFKDTSDRASVAPEGKKVTAASRCRELLLAPGRPTDTDVHKTIRLEFPAFGLSSVAYYRAELVKKGKL